MSWHSLGLLNPLPAGTLLYATFHALQLSRDEAASALGNYLMYTHLLCPYSVCLFETLTGNYK